LLDEKKQRVATEQTLPSPTGAMKDVEEHGVITDTQ